MRAAPAPEASPEAAAGGALVAPVAAWRVTAARFRRDPAGMASLLFILAVLVLALAAPWVTAYPEQGLGEPSIMAKLKPPSAEHWLGTDQLGRDIWARLVFGGRVSMAMAAMVLALALAIGIPLGIVAGVFGGVVDEVLMRVTDVFLAFPSLLLAIFISALLGAGFWSCALAIAVTWWPWYARLVRSHALVIGRRPYVEAAVVMGVGWPRILVRHVLPGVLGPVSVQATMDVGTIILTAAALAFLGLGVPPPTPDWGQIIGEGRVYFPDRWWIVTFPGLAIFLTALAFGLLGDALRSAADLRRGEAPGP